jgi:hypothetical protein
MVGMKEQRSESGRGKTEDGSADGWMNRMIRFANGMIRMMDEGG